MPIPISIGGRKRLKPVLINRIWYKRRQGVRLRITKIDEYQFLTCLKHGLWGSKTARFKTWAVGDKLAIIVEKSLAGLCEVAGSPYESRDKVWDNGLSRTGSP
jgi:hypothetical protein